MPADDRPCMVECDSESIIVMSESPLWDTMDWTPYIQETIHTACRHLNITDPYSLTCVLSDNATIQRLNHTYRDQDCPTNVLAFPQQSPHTSQDPFPQDPSALGDIILAFETISQEASAQDKSLKDHVQHLVVHGYLHLLGYDHMTPDEATMMEALETSILKTLNIKDPYA